MKGARLEIFDNILDRIYEAAIIPDLWPEVLDNIATLSQMEGGVLYAVTPQLTSLGTVVLSPVPRWTASKAVASHVEAFVRDGWLERNTRAERSVKLSHPGFVTDLDLFTIDELTDEPLYQYARQRGLGWYAGLATRVPTGDVMIFDFERCYSTGPVSRETVAQLDMLKGHLSRAALISARLGFERAKAATETLDLLGLPAAVLSAQHRILSSNKLLEAFIPSIVHQRAMGRMHLVDKKADHLFTNALTALEISTILPSPVTQVFSIPVAAKDEQSAIVVHIIPVRRAARDIFAAAASVIIVTPVSRANVPSATVIQALFDLTPAEARIANLLAGGATINEIALTSNTTRGTVRNQLKSVFHKTGVSRQADLMSLLGNINPVRTPKG